MKVEIVYPPRKKKEFQRRQLLRIARWPVWLAAYGCPIVNLCTGGKAWSVVVLMSLYILWTMVLSPDLVEYNRISQLIKLITDVCILLVLIDRLLAPGWAVTVVPMVCFGGILLSGILFFTDMDRQKQNMLPMLMLIVEALFASVVCLSIWQDIHQWPIVALGATALALLVTCIVVLGADFKRELKRRFHTR